MSTSKPIKTDLFRFASLRAPQLLSDEEKELGFILHPNLPASYFYTNVSETMDPEMARSQIINESLSFAPVDTYADVKGINVELYNLGNWLADNSKYLDGVNMGSRIATVSPLNLTEELTVWDNLFHQLINRDQPSVRQACIHLLVANNFYKQAASPGLNADAERIIQVPLNQESLSPDEKLERFLSRLADAKVVVPYEFTVSKLEVMEGEASNQSPDHEEVLLIMNAFNAEEDLSAMEGLIEEMETFDGQYGLDYENALGAAMAMHQDGVFSLRFMNAQARENQDPQNPAPTMPDPDFNFTFPAPFSNAYQGATSLSPALNFALDKFGLRDKGIGVSLEFLHEKTQAQAMKVSQDAGSGQGIMVSQGFTIDQSQQGNYHYAVGFHTPVMMLSGSSEFRMALKVGMSGLFVESASVTLAFKGGNYNELSVEEIGSKDGYLFLNLLPGQVFDTDPGGVFNLVVDLTMSNGDVLRTEQKGHSRIAGNKGYFLMQNNGGEPLVKPVLYGVHNLGIIDYRKVEQEVCCYVPGEVSHIENVMAKEYKERHTRNLVRSENTRESSSSMEQERLSDTTSTDRNEMQSEISRVLEEKKDFKAGASTSLHTEILGKADFQISGYADYASSNSATSSNKVARNMAREVTEQALDRVVSKSSEKRMSKMIREYEENNRHGFDNRAGETHVTGVYRWVDKILKNRLVNYGKRLMLEVMVPEPALFFKESLKSDSERHPGLHLLRKPRSPRQMGLKAVENLNEYNYAKYAIEYGIDLDRAPEKYIWVDEAVSADLIDRKEEFNTYKEVYLPEGYAAVYQKTDWEIRYQHKSGSPAVFNMNVGIVDHEGKYSWNSKSEGKSKDDEKYARRGCFRTDFVPGIRNKMTLTTSCFKLFWYNASIRIKCKRNQEVFLEWQVKTYQKIQEAYQGRLAEYHDQLARLASEAKAEVMAERRNPRINRQVEQRELVRASIEMMTRPFGLEIGQDHFVFETKGCLNGMNMVPKVNQTPAFEEYATMARFFEEALDWGVMSYTFYPYYWADQCQWREMLQSQDAADPVFQAFLQSGMARVLVPVSPGFEDAVTYYLETGDVWASGKLVVDTEDDYYLSVLGDLQQIDGVVEEEWESRVPSTLTVIQASSVGLDESGLPCCEDLGSGASSLISSTQTLQRDSSPTS